MRINSDNSAFNYSGRIDFSVKKEPLFIYSGSMVKVSFFGTKLGVYIKNEPMDKYSSLGIVIDNLQYKIDLIQDETEHFYPVCENLTDGEHNLTIFKRQAAAHYFRFTGIEVNDNATLSVIPQGKIKLEVFGDSVSSGEVSEAVYFTAHSDPENHGGIYDNSWFSYPLATARKLNAEIYNNSQGGLALFDKTGYFNGDNYVGLETTYDKLSYVPYAREGYTSWDFSRYTPNVVVFAIGQNDHNPKPEAIYDPEYARKWKDKYIEIIRFLKSQYGDKTKFVLLLTVLMHEPIWDKIISEIANELKYENVRHCYFKRCGKATPGHPRIPEHEEMANELSEFISDWLSE